MRVAHRFLSTYSMQISRLFHLPPLEITEYILTAHFNRQVDCQDYISNGDWQLGQSLVQSVHDNVQVVHLIAHFLH
jgi:hypothetical protein